MVGSMRSTELILGVLLLVSPTASIRQTALDLEGTEPVAFVEEGQKTQQAAGAAEADEEGQDTQFLCDQFEVRTPDGKTIKISRAKTYSHVASKILKGIIIVGLVAAVIFLSSHTASLYETFLSANTPVPIHQIAHTSSGQIISSKFVGMYYKQSAIQALVASVSMFATLGGTTGGILLTAAAAKIGANYEYYQYQHDSYVGEQTKWLGTKPDECEWVHFDVVTEHNADNWTSVVSPGSWTKYSYAADSDGLYALEEQTDAAADSALTSWCSFYGQHRLFGKGEMMPMPDVCAQLQNQAPEMNACGGDVTHARPFTCQDLISLSSAEMAFQAAMTQMKVIHNMAGKKDIGCDAGNEPDAHVGTTSPLDAARCDTEVHEDTHFCPGETKTGFVASLKDVEDVRAVALYDCMAVSSCQLLRKSGTKIQGRVRSKWSAGFLTQKHMDMAKLLTKKCLSHNSLLGPTDSTFLCMKGKDCPEDAVQTSDNHDEDDFVTEEDHAASGEDEFACPDEEPAVLEEVNDKKICKCIPGARRLKADNKCHCIDPDDSKKQSFFESKPKQCRTICRPELVEVIGDKESDCVTRFIYKAVVLAGSGAKQGDCDDGHLSVPVGGGARSCVRKDYVDYLLNE